MIHIIILQVPFLNSGAIVNLLLRLQRLIRFPLSPLLIRIAMTRPLDNGGPITRGHSSDIHTFATMDGYQGRRGIRDTEALMITRRTRVLLHAAPIFRGAPRNLEALATMGGDYLVRVGPYRLELELLVRCPGTTGLSCGRPVALRAARYFQALVTMRCRE